MAKSLKQKTVSGLTWSFIDNIADYGIQFVVGIILARLLSPNEYGLIGMVMVFIAISKSLVNSGFTQALIRKNDAIQKDYSTAFYFNIGSSLFFYLILFLSSQAVSRFYNQPELELILKVLGISIIFDAFAIIQRARLIKRIDFKLQTKISVISSVISGVVGIAMAYFGYGVWSLVAKILTRQFLITALLWLLNKWRPSFEFSLASFKELFSFGSRLLLSGLINTAYKNVYKLVIGKYFSAAELGYFSRANQFSALLSTNLTAVIQRVSYPVLSSIQDDTERLKSMYRRIIKSIMLISFVSMLSLAAVAKSLILTLIGEKWLPSVLYLQLLCFGGMLYPLHAVNLNILNVYGKSDLFLKLEIIKKALAVPAILVGIFWGIPAMIIAMFFNSIVAYFINSYNSGKLIGYSSFEQVKDIMPSFLFGLVVGVLVFFIGFSLSTPPYVTLAVQVLAGIALFFTGSELLNFKDYLYLKRIVIEKMSGKNK